MASNNDKVKSNEVELPPEEDLRAFKKLVKSLMQDASEVLLILLTHMRKNVCSANLCSRISALMSTCNCPWCSVPLLEKESGKKS